MNSESLTPHRSKVGPTEVLRFKEFMALNEIHDLDIENIAIETLDSKAFSRVSFQWGNHSKSLWKSLEFKSSALINLASTESRWIQTRHHSSQFLDCDFRNSHWQDSLFENCNFARCEWSYAQWEHCTFNHPIGLLGSYGMESCQLHHTSFTSCTFVGLEMGDLDLFTLEFIKFKRCTFVDCNLTAAQKLILSRENFIVQNQPLLKTESPKISPQTQTPSNQNLASSAIQKSLPNVKPAIQQNLQNRFTALETLPLTDSSESSKPGVTLVSADLPPKKDLA